MPCWPLRRRARACANRRTTWSTAPAPTRNSGTARALAELRHAYAEGFRSVVDFEDFVRMEDSPNFQGLREDPEFRAIAARIDADNARTLARVLANRDGGRRT